MEQLDEINNLTPEQRINRFVGYLNTVVGVDDLFPPDSGVRELACGPRVIGPKVGAVALRLVWENPEQVDMRPLYLIRS